MKRWMQMFFVGAVLVSCAAAIGCNGRDSEDPMTAAIAVLLDPTSNSVCLFGPCKYIFVTSNTYNGNLQNPTGADSRCMSDPGKPAGSRNFKALVVAANLRRAQPSPQKDWALQSNTWYIRPNLDSTQQIVNTTAIAFAGSDGFLVTPLQNPLSETSAPVWTGFNDSLFITDDVNDCLDWSTSLGGIKGRAGNAARTSYNVASETLEDCSQSLRLICAEQ